MRLRGAQPLRLYVAAVSVAGIGLLIGLAFLGMDDLGRHISPMFWVFTGVTFLGELLPIKFLHRAEEDEVTVSTAFAFALVLSSGVLAAVLAQILASLVADRRAGKSAAKSVFNMAQYALALGASGGVLALMADIPHPGAPPHFTVGDLPAIVVAALTFFVVNTTLTGIVVALAQREPITDHLSRDLAFQVGLAGVLLGLSPIVVMVAERSLLYMPLLLLPLGAVYVGGRQVVKTEYQALYDALTGLPNRALFQDRVQRAILAARRTSSGVAVMIIDVDRFKEVNDTLGHHHGDRLLTEIGSRLEASLRQSDTVARLGGDEFAVLFPDASTPESAVRMAEKIQRGLAEPFVIGEVTLDVEASIGIALYPYHGDDAETLLQRADVAMYLAKDSHSGHEVYDPTRDSYSPDRLAMMAELRHAIDNEELFVVFQPIADLQTARIVGVEALCRWQHPRHGLVMPDDFIPLAEHTGLIGPLTLRIVDQALRWCRDWEQAALELSVSVNLSARNLLDPQLPDAISGLLRKWKVASQRLELEITESSIMADPSRSMEVLTRLDNMGIRLSIDDFGTGYSSLAYLKRLPVHENKIDKSFVLAMTSNENDAVIVRSTIELGRNLGLRVVAEGVENEEVWDLLVGLGCHLAQGYYLSRPIPPHELTPLLERSALKATDHRAATSP
jgi:diguanylate cyclase (GGDEF)-like protein